MNCCSEEKLSSSHFEELEKELGLSTRHCDEAKNLVAHTLVCAEKSDEAIFSRKQRWLITGGAGFIGSHIAERLLKDGHFVRILDNFSSGKEENLSFAKGENFELIRGDIRDKATCDRACEVIDYISHQAALRSVPKSLEIPHDFNAVNIDGSLNILEAALKHKVKRVVIASSSSVYGDAKKFPQKESDTPLLISPYALSKLAVEHYSRVFSVNYGLETINLRYFNVFGPRQALDDEYAVVIPKFITCMLNDEQPPIHGDGKQSRDFTYIDNVVDANILAATHRHCEEAEMLRQPSHRHCEEPPKAATKQSLVDTFNEVFNVACGEDHSINNLVVMLNEIMEKRIFPKYTPSRAGDVRKTNADVSKIKKLLKFKPKVSFKEGLKKTLEWFDLQRLSVCG